MGKYTVPYSPSKRMLPQRKKWLTFLKGEPFAKKGVQQIHITDREMLRNTETGVPQTPVV